jgi:type IV pilus assembly protein PilA
MNPNVRIHTRAKTAKLRPSARKPEFVSQGKGWSADDGVMPRDNRLIHGLRSPEFSRHSANDAGFTLIELMVVLLILAILLAIAIPTFLGITRSANDKAAQSDLNTALINAKILFQANSQTYNLPTNATYTTPLLALVASMGSAEPSLAFISGTSSGPSSVSVNLANDGRSVAVAALATGDQNCWFLVDNVSNETTTTAGSQYAGIVNFGANASGTWYGEWKMAGAANCSVSQLPTTANSNISFMNGSFPSL